MEALGTNYNAHSRGDEIWYVLSFTQRLDISFPLDDETREGKGYLLQ